MLILRFLVGIYYCLSQSLGVRNVRSVKGKVTKDNNVTIKFSKGCRVYGMTVTGHGEILIGANVEIRNLYVHLENYSNLVICEDSFIGVGVKITCADKIVINKGTLISPNVVIVDNDHVIGGGDIRDSGLITEPTIIGENCWVGASSVICKGAYLNDNSVLGALSLLNTKTSHSGVYFGVPAKFIREVK